MTDPPRSPLESPEDEQLLWHLHRDDPDTRIREAVTRFRPNELVGLTVNQALARVEGAGGSFEAGPGPMTADYKLHRMRVMAENDLVIEARVG